MTNKKGFSIFRVILYILFLVVTILIFVLTFNAIKEGNSTKSNKSDIFESRILMEAPSNTTSSGADFVQGIQFGCFTSASISSNNNLTNCVKVQQFQNTLTLSPVLSSTDSNVLDLSNSLRNFYWFMEDNTLDGSYQSYGYFSTYLSGIIIIKCDIPISMAKFKLSGSYCNDITGNRRLYYATNLDIDSMGNVVNNHYKAISNSSLDGAYYYDLSVNLDSNVLNATSIKYLAFYTYQSSTQSTGVPITDYNYMPWLNANNYPSNNTLMLDFEVSQLSSDAVFWYNEGYNDAISNIDSSLTNENYDLINQVNSLTNDNLDLKQQVSVLSSLVESLQRQLNESNNNFKNLFFTIADVPFKTVSNVLGFEVLGVNLFKFFTGIITALAFIWLIKKIL